MFGPKRPTTETTPTNQFTRTVRPAAYKATKETATKALNDAGFNVAFAQHGNGTGYSKIIATITNLDATNDNQVAAVTKTLSGWEQIFIMPKNHELLRPTQVTKATAAKQYNR